MVRVLMFVASWFGLMWASLQVGKFNLGHSICGAWGCGPPLEALLSIHLFWIALAVPPLVMLSRWVAAPWKFLGTAILFVVMAALIGIGIWDVSSHRATYQAGYYWQRYLFSVATLVDVPVPAALLSGIALRIFGPGPSSKTSELA